MWRATNRRKDACKMQTQTHTHTLRTRYRRGTTIWITVGCACVFSCKFNGVCPGGGVSVRTRKRRPEIPPAHVSLVPGFSKPVNAHSCNPHAIVIIACIPFPQFINPQMCRRHVCQTRRDLSASAWARECAHHAPVCVLTAQSVWPEWIGRQITAGAVLL